MSRVSVAMATFNGAAYIADQIDSILGQSRPVDEVVVSDDGSSDDTVDQIRRAFAAFEADPARTAPDLVVLRNPAPLGITANFEQALGHCTGDLIALSDQDDVWHRDRIERQVACFDADPALLLVATNARSVDADGLSLGYDHFTALELAGAELAAFREGRPFETLLRRNVATGATMMMRRSLVERARPFPSSWLHDEWLAMIGAVLGRLALLDASLIDYRQHGRNQVGMRRLSLTDKFGRFLEPRSERNRRLLERARALEARLAEMPGIAPAIRGEAARKARFEARRSALPANRLARLPAIVRDLISGDYARYGTGWRDAVRFLVQPADEPAQANRAANDPESRSP